MPAVTIDWDAAAVRAIIECRDGQQAWEMLLAYIGHRGQRIELSDAIWSKRQQGMPKRGGRKMPRSGRLRLRAGASVPTPEPPQTDPAGRDRPKDLLDGPGVGALVGKHVAGAVARHGHVNMAQSRLIASALDDACNHVDRQR